MPLWESSRFSFPGHDGLSPGGKQPQALHSARPPRGQESLELAGPVGTMTWLEAVIVQTGSGLPVSTELPPPAKPACTPEGKKEPRMV